MSHKPVVIIGAGWAGLAAAVKLTQAGHQVDVYESAKQVGGRARGVNINNVDIDNGQHILIGAYTECLALMKVVNIDTNKSLKKLPFLLTVIDKVKLVLKAPALPAPLHLLYALLTAKGLHLKDRFAAIKFGLYLKKTDYQLDIDITVEELFKKTKQTPVLVRQLWEPLCLSTMNTPIKIASANVFMKVFKDAFTNKREDANLLLPTTDLSHLFPLAAIKYITNNGGNIYLKSRIEKLKIENNKIIAVTAKKGNELTIQETSNVIIATAPQNINKLLNEHPQLNSINQKISQFHYQPIVTVYLQYSEDVKLTQPMIGLSSTVSQWAFDRGAFCNQAGLISVVISAEGEHMEKNDDTLTQQVHKEISILFPQQVTLLNSFVIREKRATFSCDVNVNDIRPTNSTNIKGLYLAGDYTNTYYPATLEGAVRSGITASKLIIDKTND